MKILLMLSVSKNLGTKSLVGALLQGSFPRCPLKAAGEASLKKRELSCVLSSSYLSY